MMSQKTKPFNSEIPNFRYFSERLVAERKRVGFSQADLRARTGVGKNTQVNYESGVSYPDAEYLAVIDGLGMDVMYLLTGVRSAGALDDEVQNLVDAYTNAGDATKAAVFGVLVTPYSEDARRARKEPGWFANEVRGDEDVRYVRSVDVEPPPMPTLHDAPDGMEIPGKLEQPDDDDPDVPTII